MASLYTTTGWRQRQKVVSQEHPSLGNLRKTITEVLSMKIISEKMPLVADQAGVWEGEYVHLDADQNIIDRHKSRLVCRLFDGPDGEARLSQTNIYTWADGTQEIRYFDGVFKGDRVWIKNDLIDGWTGSVSLDPTNRTIMVGW